MDKKIYLEYLAFMNLEDDYTIEQLKEVYFNKLNNYQEEEFFDIENILYLNKAKSYLEIALKEKENNIFINEREENYKKFYELYRKFEEKIENNNSLFTTTEKKEFMNRALEISKSIGEDKFNMNDMLALSEELTELIRTKSLSINKEKDNEKNPDPNLKEDKQKKDGLMKNIEKFTKSIETFKRKENFLDKLARIRFFGNPSIYQDYLLTIDGKKYKDPRTNKDVILYYQVCFGKKFVKEIITGMKVPVLKRGYVNDRKKKNLYICNSGKDWTPDRGATYWPDSHYCPKTHEIRKYYETYSIEYMTNLINSAYEYSYVDKKKHDKARKKMLNQQKRQIQKGEYDFTQDAKKEEEYNKSIEKATLNFYKTDFLKAIEYNLPIGPDDLELHYFSLTKDVANFFKEASKYNKQAKCMIDNIYFDSRYIFTKEEIEEYYFAMKHNIETNNERVMEMIKQAIIFNAELNKGQTYKTYTKKK